MATPDNIGYFTSIRSPDRISVTSWPIRRKNDERPDAAGDGDSHVAARCARLLLEHPQPADLGIHLFGGLFADVAGIEKDEIGVLGRFRRSKTLARKDVRHTIGIVDVHLAAIGLDENPFSLSHRQRCGFP
jgi:hypothetical protein